MKSPWSDSTKSYDRDRKFEGYRAFANFQEYLLIDQTRMHVEQFSKTAKNNGCYANMIKK
ncbi:MAG: hypothetical protein BRC42_06875 [Cyanobacteria bacterium QS_1_48_34]|nr:MAG: hypothetical protein BRC42_06875 [Cyanobacteria bacterium QS_1_48_34]